MKRNIFRILLCALCASLILNCSKDSNTSNTSDLGYIKLKMNGIDWQCSNAYFQIQNIPSPSTLVTVEHYDLDDANEISFQRDKFSGIIGRDTMTRFLFEYKDSTYIATNIPYYMTSYDGTHIAGTVDNITFDPNSLINLNSNLPYKSKLSLTNISFSIPKQ